MVTDGHTYTRVPALGTCCCDYYHLVTHLRLCCATLGVQACPQLQYVCIKDCAGLSPAYQQEVEAMKPYTYDGDTRA
jgi:hypothetical protein